MAVDVPFTPQEAWIFSQFGRSSDDKHPDAHSCRAKLGLAVVFSTNKCKWEMHHELGSYLSKLAHVSAACRLTEEQERDALHHCQSATGMIKNRLAYLNAKRAGEDTVMQKGDVPRAGGQPWQKLCTLGYDYILGNGCTPGRVQYRRPGQEEPKPDYSRGPMPGMPMPMAPAPGTLLLTYYYKPHLLL